MKLFFAKPVIWIPLAVLAASACSDQSAPPAERPFEVDAPEAQSGSVPVVTLEHWRDSTPNERYAFLIGFVTMLEMEKEWQGQYGGGLLPFDRSLAGSWVEGFAHRPLAEIYRAVSRHLADHPGDLDRPVAEVMWFTLVQPRLDEKRALSPAPENQSDFRPR